MVNPILATIIKKAIQQSYEKSQTGGGNEGGNSKMKFLGFLGLIILIIIIEFVICDVIARNVIKNIKEETAGTTTTGATTTGATTDELTEEQLKKYKETMAAIYVPLIFINALAMYGLFYFMSKGEKNKDVYVLFSLSFGIMIFFIILSYIIKVIKSKKDIYFSEYIGVSGYTPLEIGMGMMTNIIFGFIDNFGLFFGMDNLDDFLNAKQNAEREQNVRNVLRQEGGGTFEQIECLYNNPGDLSSLQTAGWGNTFSDFLGAFVGNAIGDISLTLANVERTPIISEIIGIVIGCVAGIYVPAKMKREGMLNAIINLLTFNMLGLSKKQVNECDDTLKNISKPTPPVSVSAA